MGRNKIKIEKKADNQQLATYNKRKNGIGKKTRELAILCDIDALLLSTSPKGKIDLVLGPNSTLEDVILRYCDLSPEERHESRLENIEIIKKAFKGDPGHEVDVQQLMNHGVSTNSQVLQGQQSDEMLRSFLDWLVDIDYLPMINSYHNLSQMEFALENLINLNKQKKMSMLEERARAIAFQHLNPQMAMNLPGPQNGNTMNQGTNLIQSNMYLTDSNMESATNSIRISDPPMAVPESDKNSLRISDPPMAVPESDKNSIRISDPPMAVPESDKNSLRISDPPMEAPESDGNSVTVPDPPMEEPKLAGNSVMVHEDFWEKYSNWYTDACEFGD